jgi:hypothetical protein
VLINLRINLSCVAAPTSNLHTQSSHQGVRYFSENLQYLFAGSSFGSLTAIFGTLCPAGAIGTDLNLHLRFDTGK